MAGAVQSTSLKEPCGACLRKRLFIYLSFSLIPFVVGPVSLRV
jgi:hypothetical protein